MNVKCPETPRRYMSLVFGFYLSQNIKSEGRRQKISDVGRDNVKENRKMALVGRVI